MVIAWVRCTSGIGLILSMSAAAWLTAFSGLCRPSRARMVLRRRATVSSDARSLIRSSIRLASSGVHLSARYVDDLSVGVEEDG